MDFRQCKIKYLSNQNEWLSLQCKNLDQINSLYKEVMKKIQKKQKDSIKINKKDQNIYNQVQNHNRQLQNQQRSFTQNNQLKLCSQDKEKNIIFQSQQNNQNSISNIDQINGNNQSISFSIEKSNIINEIQLQQLSDIQYFLKQTIKSHKNHIKNLRIVDHKNKEKFQDQSYLYYESIQSYDQTLLQLSSDVLLQQMQLQKVEGKRQQKRRAQIEQRLRDSSFNQFIQDYQAYPKLLQHFNKKKDILLQRLSSCKSISSNILNQSQSLYKVKQRRKTSKPVYNSNDSIFETAVLCLKKKKYQNNQLKKIISQLRRNKQQIQCASFKIQSSLQQQINQQKQQKLSQKQTIKKIVEQDFSINISRIGGRTILNGNRYDNFNKQILNNCILNNLDGMGVHLKGFSQQIWEDIPSLLID